VDTQQADLTPVRFSTDELSDRDRISVWRELWGRSVFGAEIEPEPDVPFHLDVTVRSLPGVVLLSSFASPGRLLRTPALVADGIDSVGLVLSSSGAVVSQFGREITVSAGSASAMATADPSTLSWQSSAYVRGILMPRAALSPLVANLDDALLQPIPHHTEALQYLLSYVQLLEERRPPLKPDVARLAATHVGDLVALALGATRDAAFLAANRGLRAARLEAIKHCIARNSDDHGLTIHSVAAQFHMTPRSLQRLFEADGTTFSLFMLDQRLARAHRLLGDPRYAGWTVSAIAFEVGFGDLAYFNRCFRRRFGGSPTELRAACPIGTPPG
jgi:AraC-like DNA-binding protein